MAGAQHSAALRDDTAPRFLRIGFGDVALAAGLAWAIAFVFVGLRFELQTYGDGAIFAYSVAVQDAWAFHWRNISGRLFSYGFAFVPAELVVAVTHSARAGIVAYGALHFAAPLVALGLTRVCDSSPNKVFLRTAALSTALLCPLVFGFPTEMWMAHALFWPTLALAHGAPRRLSGMLAFTAVLLAFVLTHEGAIALLAAILVTLAFRRGADGVFVRGMVAAAIVTAIWLVVKRALPPDDYIAGVLGAAAWKFIDPANLTSPMPVLFATALGSYAALAWLGAWWRLPMPNGMAAAVVAVALAIHWTLFDAALHAEQRYPIRTALLMGLPVLAAGAAALAADVAHYAEVIRPAIARLQVVLRSTHLRRLAIGAVSVSMLVHVGETVKFVAAWTAYRTELRALATGEASDPQLGDPRFVSALRVTPALDRLAWNSTTPYLSVLVAPSFLPRRLIVDPRTGYFWISCGMATRSAVASVAIPEPSRELIRIYACRHR